MKFIRHILNSRPAKGGDFFIALKSILGFAPRDIEIYQRAFTHCSLQETDAEGNPLNYERLEFLGDAMLGSVVAAYLFQEVPDADEGYLTKMRAKIVSRKSLNQLGKDFNLIQFMKADCHQEQFGDNVHGNLVEALVGAIYEDRGFTFCEQFIHNKIIADYINLSQLEEQIVSYKSYLIEWCQKEKKNFSFDDCEDTGKEEVKHFVSRLSISGKLVAKARSTSKKKAEEKAARRAYFALQDKINI